jgi:choline dehydrogenase-like flavoprotein
MATGNLELRCNAMAREVLVGADGLAKSVSYIDKNTLKEVQVFGKIIVLAASNCETTRLLLNSKSRMHPNGIANSNGLVGKVFDGHRGS